VLVASRFHVLRHLLQARRRRCRGALAPA
jgi:hypothetical protein